MRIHNYSNEKGVAIFITLMLLFLLSLAIAGVLLTAYNYNNICEAQIRRQKALASAEAGIHYACYQLRNNAVTNFYPNCKDVANADTSLSGLNGFSDIKVWVEDFNPPVSGKYIIRTKVTYPKAQSL